jgi:hypothetical protein
VSFVDPDSRTIEVLKLSGQDLIVAVAIDVGALWDSPPPPSMKP